ncbi:MAG: crossover junction endodeoxyribonuclease RuvC, partial [Chloroflexi bacterium]|nr:crossover junction endodeoxyribonuclease RuvC [Chloroflexota bacterium]
AVPDPHDVADALAVAICHWWIAHSPVAAAVRAQGKNTPLGAK